jgi:hypothetical protein
MDASEFQIQRDGRYYDTLARDMRRQHARRFVHGGARWIEKQFILTPDRARDLNAPTRKGRKTLSTCIMTMNAADRIRPLLEYLRPHTDELVVGVDSKSTDATFERCQGLADELFIIENDALTCNAGMEALVRRCHGDWILRLDDDEFPEPELWRYRDFILSTEKFTHYKLPRLHLVQVEPMRWINDGYLYPDFQMRLFQNKPELLTFPGAVGHLGIQCAGKKGRLNSINLIHLNLAINPRQKREEKLHKYVIRHHGGWVHPINERALLFEDFPYRIQPYHHPDAAFCRTMVETVRQQQAAYQQQLQPSAV